MYKIRSGSSVESACSVSSLFDKLAKFSGKHVAVHFLKRSGIKRVIFISVDETGVPMQSYGAGCPISISDFELA